VSLSFYLSPTLSLFFSLSFSPFGLKLLSAKIAEDGSSVLPDLGEFFNWVAF